MTRLMGFLLRVILAPAVIVMTLIQVVLAFILILSTHVLSVIASLMLTFAIIVMYTGNHRDGFLLIGISFMLCPWGLPKIAEGGWRLLNNIRGFLFRRVFC